MAIQNEPTRIQIPFADSGTKNVIPDTNSTPSASQAASWTDGFPSQCSLPLSAGGIPPARADFNGIFNTITQSERFTQEGGIWAWDATVDYAANRLVLGSDGMLYWSIAQSGPNLGGAQDPTTDDGTCWGTPSMPTMPTGDDSQAVATTGFVGAAINIAIPVGTVIWSANPAAPSGYLPCNGAAVGRATYPELFAAIGTIYGAGDGSTTFNLPDLIDRFPQGNATPGTVKTAGLPNVVGKFSAQGVKDNDYVGNVSYWDEPNKLFSVARIGNIDDGNSQSAKYQTGVQMDLSKGNSIYGNSDTVQPPALTLLPCIRYE